MKKTLFFLLSFLSLMILIMGLISSTIPKFLNLIPKAGLRVEASSVADVYLDNQPLGKTPLQKEDLSADEHLIKLTSTNGSWQGYVRLHSGTLTVVNRDLAESLASSSGEIISLDKGEGVTVTSNPSGSEILVDGKDEGKTPVSFDVPSGEHIFQVSHSNFLTRNVRAVVSAGFNLTLAMDLAIAQADLKEIPTPTVSPTLTVKQTPTGFLNVRDQPGLNGNLIEKVQVGDTLQLLQEGDTWDKVQLPDGKEGYVSVQYVQSK